MAKKRATSRKKSRGWLWSLMATVLTGTSGAGVGGWVNPDLPVAGPAVQQFLNFFRHRVRERVADATGVPEEKLPTLLGPLPPETAAVAREDVSGAHRSR